MPEPGNGATVLGLDGYPGGWACVALQHGAVTAAFTAPTIEAAAGRFPGAAVIGVDMPFALMTHGPRRADAASRLFAGRRGNSVFPVPPAPALGAASHAEAVIIAREHGGPAPSAQCYALFPKIREAAAAREKGLPLFEMHPEVCFCALGDGEAAPRKRTWNGLRHRLWLLEAAGIVLPGCEGDDVPADDLVDAAAVAWSAVRVAAGTAQTLPADPTAAERAAGMLVWY